jgi:cytidyltransferase-like protein
MHDASPAPIIGFDEFNARREEFGTIVCTSGGFDPIHPGHLTCIAESKKFGDTVVVLVNGDEFLTRKKGKPFQDLETRSRIVSHVRGVDFVIPFITTDPEDMTVREGLSRLKPHIFTKGGDRCSPETIPEWDVCQNLGIKVETGVGEPKNWSSSEFLAKWKEK